MAKDNSEIEKLLQESQYVVQTSGAAIISSDKEMEDIRRKKKEIETKLSFLL